MLKSNSSSTREMISLVLQILICVGDLKTCTSCYMSMGQRSVTLASSNM